MINTIFLKQSLVLPFALASLSFLTHAADIYVAPTGSSSANGGLANPVDLGTGLNGVLAHPGDTVWLRGGTYRGSFYSYLSGTASQPVTVRQYPGERATIDGGLVQANGGYCTYRDFELTRSSNTRVSSQSGSGPTDLPIQDGFNVRAPSIKVVNLIVHDIVGCGVAA
jgi:hypothetical protein